MKRKGAHMKEFKILPRNKMFELYNILNKENIPEARVIAIREIDLSSIERARKKAAADTNSDSVIPTLLLSPKLQQKS